MLKIIKFVLFVVFLMVAVVFGSQNPQLIELNYLIAKGEWPLATVIGIFLLIGFLLGLLVSSWLFTQLHWRLFLSRRTNKSPDVEE